MFVIIQYTLISLLIFSKQTLQQKST